MKFARCKCSRDNAVALAFGGVVLAFLGALVYYDLNHVGASNIPGQVWVMTMCALLTAFVASFVAYRYPGDDKNPGWRHFWSLADLAWLLVAVLSFSRVLAPVGELLQGSQQAAETSGDMFLRQDLQRAIWKEKDRRCSTPGPVLAECIYLDRLERQFQPDRKAEFVAKALLREIAVMCGNGCPPSLIAVEKAAAALVARIEAAAKSQEEFARLSPQLRKPVAVSPEDTILWAYVTMLALTLGFGVRWGRTIAEVRRNIDRDRENRRPARAQG
jgi:hypothetical protein